MIGDRVDGVNVFAAGIIALLLSLAPATAAHADATLSLHRLGSGPVLPGQQVQIVLRMSGIPPATPAAGFQAFLSYNTQYLTFVSGTYTAAPFGLHIIAPIAASGSDINLASGTNAFIGQTPTSSSADLATFTFQVNTSCGFGPVKFRANLPPSRLTDEHGQPLTPMALLDLGHDLPCASDINSDDAVNVLDLLLVITTWGLCPPLPACCPSDIDATGVVNVLDLLDVITSWGPCP